MGGVSNRSAVVVNGDDRLNSLGGGESIAATTLTLVLNGGALADALGIGGCAPVDGVVIGVTGENLVEGSLDSLGAILQKTSESFLFLFSHVGDEIVADGRGLIGLGVPLLDKSVGLLEKSHSGVELINGVVALTVLGNVLHELESGCVDGGHGGKKGNGGESLHNRNYYLSFKY